MKFQDIADHFQKGNYVGQERIQFMYSISISPVRGTKEKLFMIRVVLSFYYYFGMKEKSRSFVEMKVHTVSVQKYLSEIFEN